MNTNPIAAHPELIPVFFCVLGLIFAAFGIGALVRARRFAARASRATGTVVDVTTRWYNPNAFNTTGSFSARGGWLRFPVVRYETAEGRPVTFTSRTGTSPSPYKPGRQVPVLYDPANPRDARINTFMMTGLLPGCFVAFGAFFVVLSGAILLLMRWASSNLPH